MIKKIATSLALVAGCAFVFAIPASQAQTQSEWSGSAVRNNAESREYMRLLQTNGNFRQARISKECGPLTNAQLYQNCVASFDVYTPFAGDAQVAGNKWYPPNPQTYTEPSSLRAEIGDTTRSMTGSTMPTTGITGTTGRTAAPGAGTDVTVLPYAPRHTAILPGTEYHPYASGQPYGVVNYWQPDQTYPGQITDYPPFTTPFYPGPRPAGQKSGP